MDSQTAPGSAPAPSWPDRSTALRQLAQYLTERNADRVRDLLIGARIPSEVIKQYWGGGVRLPALSLPKLAEGLGRALLNDNFMRRLICAAFESPLRDAISRWPGRPERFEWISHWHQPVAEMLYLLEDHPQGLPERCRLDRIGRVHVLLPSQPQAIDGLVVSVTADIPGLALEIVDGETVRVLVRPEFSKLLRTNDLGHMVQVLVAVPRADRIAAAYASLFNNDLEGASRFVREHQRGEGRNAAHRHLRTLIALGTHRIEEAAMLADELDANSRQERLLRGLVWTAMGEHLKGARELARVPAQQPSVRAFPLLLAASSLKAGRLAVPAILERIAQKGWATVEERKEVEEALKMVPDHETVQSTLVPPVPTLAPAIKSTFPRRSELESILARGRSEDAQAQTAMQEGQYALASEKLSILSRLQAQLDELRERLAQQLGGETPRMRVAAPESDANAFLVQLHEVWARACAQQAKELDQQRASARQQFERAGMTPPQDLEAACSIEAIKEILQAQEEVFQARAAVQECLVNGSIASLALLSAGARLFALREVVAGGGTGIGDLVPRVVSDDALWAQAPLEVGQILVSALPPLIKKQSEVAPAAWKRIAEAFGPKTAEKLRAGGVLDALEVQPPLQIQPLAELLLGAEGVAGPRLSGRLAVARAEALPPTERIPALSRLALTMEEQSVALSALYRSLVEMGREGDALYLVATVPEFDLDPSELKACAKQVLLNATAMPSEQALDVVRALLSQTDWFVEQDEDVALLLHLFRRTGLHAELTQARYHHASEIDAVRARFPRLIGELLGEWVGSDPEDRHAKARTELAEFEDELGRTTCWADWGPATEYQKEFIRSLRAMLAALAEGKPLESVKPQELISRVHVPGVKPATGRALRAMNRYLEAQLGRLETIAESLRSTTLDRLRSQPLPPRVATLRAERAGLPAGHALGQTFDQLLGEA